MINCGKGSSVFESTSTSLLSSTNDINTNFMYLKLVKGYLKLVKGYSDMSYSKIIEIKPVEIGTKGVLK